jgi:ATP-dependent DNA ligase
MDKIIKCIEDIAKEKKISMEELILDTINKKLLLIPNTGLSGTVVYPTINEPITVIKGDTYVPGLADKFMLAFDYYDKKTKKITEITSRTSDYQYSTGIPKAPIGWYMSEKFDGQRAMWDGSKFVTRGSANSFPRVYPYVPIWFIALMPPGIALDGEFFIKRNSFQEIGFLKSKLKKESDRKSKDNTILDLDKKWINIKYQVFDIPSNTNLFEERMSILKELVKERCGIWKRIPFPPYLNKEECPLIFTEQYLIKSEKNLDEYYSGIVSQEAEGVMIRAPKIPYIPTRTRLILKLKGLLYL